MFQASEFGGLTEEQLKEMLRQPEALATVVGFFGLGSPGSEVKTPEQYLGEGFGPDMQASLNRQFKLDHLKIPQHRG